ncbi:hypothetical protein L494_1079, partial [Bordetella bronchiseptica CA90 BB1334]
MAQLRPACHPGLGSLRARSPRQASLHPGPRVARRVAMLAGQALAALAIALGAAWGTLALAVRGP